MTPDEVRKVAETVTTVVGTVIGVSVAASVAASVVASVGGAGAAAAASGPGALAIIGQVQILTQLGKVGGKSGGANASSLAQLSGSMTWANAELPFSFFPGGNVPEPDDNEEPAFAKNIPMGESVRRFMAKTRRAFRRNIKLTTPDVGKTYEMANDPACQDTDSLTEEQKLKCLGCGFVNGMPLLDKLTVVFGSIMIFFGIRWFLQFVWTKCLKKEPMIALSFPLWEGPLLIVHWFGLCESLSITLGRPCPGWWGATVVIIIFGPLGFLLYAAYKIRTATKAGEIVMIHTPEITWKDTRKKITETKGIIKKISLVNAWYVARRHRGEWQDNPTSRKWLFLIKDFVSWQFFAWLLLKKLIFAGAMCLTFEITNSAIVMFLEFFHIVVLFNWVPYEDNVANAQELFGGVTNLSTMIFASLPALLGPAEMPEFLSDFMIMGFALAGTAAAAISCIASSVFALFGLIAGMIAQIIAPVQDLMGGICAGGAEVNTGFGGEAFEVLGEVAGEVGMEAGMEAGEELGEGMAEAGEELGRETMQVFTGEGGGMQSAIIGTAIGASVVSSGLQAFGKSGVSIGEGATDADYVHIILRLLLAFHEAGEEDSKERAEFEHQLVEDLALASGMPTTCFEIDSVEKGSIFVHMTIYREESGSLCPGINLKILAI